MKTFIDFFQELSPEIAAQAIENTPDNILNKTEESLKSALLGAFVWQKTPQGRDYWREIYDSLN